MSDDAADPNLSTVLKAFARKGDGRISPTDLKKLIKGPIDAAALDRTLSGLIERGHLAFRGGKAGEHPRAKGAYSLTKGGAEEAREHARPPRPDVEDELLEYQRSFILLQVFRAADHSLSRSDLNAKLKSKLATQSLEFDPSKHPSTVDFHLHLLAEEGCLEAHKRGVGFLYELTDAGRHRLIRARQYTSAEFRLKGEDLNALLAIASESRRSEVRPESPGGEAGQGEPHSIGMDDVLNHLERLRAEEYRGGELVPIHALRRRVAAASGPSAAGHDSLDPLLKRMRVENHVRLVAINVLADATPEELEASIPGMNETLFFVD